MPNQSNHSYFPTLTQGLLAAIFGVLLGLALSYGMDRGRVQVSKAPITSENSQSLVSQKVEEAKSLLDPSRIKLWPTLNNRTNILLMGVDSNGKHTKRFENTRSDTMILASIDPFNKKVGLISIPRDSRVRIPEREDHLDKINAAHALGGPELAVKTVETALSVPIDHYVVIDRVGLKDVFEMVGPVEVKVEKRMRYRDRAAGLDIDLEPGVQELNAQQVEQYLRFRYDHKGDIGRIDRQQWFMRQAQKKLRDPAVLLKIPQLIQFASNYVVTDMTVQDMTALTAFAKDLGSDSIETATLPGEGETIHGGSYWVVNPEATALVLKRLAGVTPSVSRIAEATSDRIPLDGVEADSELAQEIRPGHRSFRSFMKNDYSSTAETLEKPLSVVIRYPRGQEETAKDFENTLSQAGYRVRSLIRCRVNECQHEQIELNSIRADAGTSEYLRTKFPRLKEWAVVMNPHVRTRTDMTLLITPDTAPLLPTDTVKATLDYSIHGFHTGEIKSSAPRNKNSGYKI